MSPSDLSSWFLPTLSHHNLMIVYLRFSFLSVLVSVQATELSKVMPIGQIPTLHEKDITIRFKTRMLSKAHLSLEKAIIKSIYLLLMSKTRRTSITEV